MPSHNVAYHGAGVVRQRFRGKRAGKQVLERETAKVARAKAKVQAQKTTRSSSAPSASGATSSPSSHSPALSSLMACRESLVSPISVYEQRLADEMLATTQSEGWAGDVAMLRRAPALERRYWDEHAGALLAFTQEMQNLAPLLRALALGQPYSAQAHVTALRLLVQLGDRCLRTSSSLRSLLAEHSSGTWLRQSDATNRRGGLQAS